MAADQREAMLPIGCRKVTSEPQECTKHRGNFMAYDTKNVASVMERNVKLILYICSKILMITAL